MKLDNGEPMDGQARTDGGAWLGTLMARYERPLVRYATRITRDVDRARDVVQDTFLKLLSTARAPRDNHVAQWLFAVCRNRALDVIRKEKRMSTMSDAFADAQAAREGDPPAAAERRETYGRAVDALADLPDVQQEVVRLKFQNGFTYRQIAEITGRSASNVGFLLHTALTTLRRKLEARPGHPGQA